MKPIHRSSFLFNLTVHQKKKGGKKKKKNRDVKNVTFLRNTRAYDDSKEYTDRKRKSQENEAGEITVLINKNMMFTSQDLMPAYCSYITQQQYIHAPLHVSRHTISNRRKLLYMYMQDVLKSVYTAMSELNESV